VHLGDLIGQTHPASVGPDAQVGVVRIKHDAEVDPAFNAIGDYFGTHVDRQAIRIVVGDDDVGYLDRDDVRRLGAPNSGFGDSARASLPGLPFGATAFVASGAGESGDDPPPGLIKMRCPIVACPDNPVYVAISMLTHTGGVLKCAVHPDTNLEVHLHS
jgi:hypothetical protein